MIHTLSFPELLTYGLLTCAVAALWFTPRTNRALRPAAWNILFLASLACGLAFRQVSVIALPAILVFGAACYGVESTRLPRVVRMLAAIAVIGFSFALMLHVVPGFGGTKLIDSVRLSRDTLPYSKWLNFDKVIIGLFILASGHRLLDGRGEWLRMTTTAGPFLPLIFLVVFPLGYVLGYVHFDAKWPVILGAWMWTNLFFTCIAEEALCRGFIQRHLEGLFSNLARGKLLALCLASAIFGAMHAAGGVRYVVLAAVSGFGYGFVYQRTGRIEAAVLTHFLLNLTHILLFSYPALA
jgi:membrane protease YdiL (CAAX protease family)